jgi:hypothetical protein
LNKLWITLRKVMILKKKTCQASYPPRRPLDRRTSEILHMPAKQLQLLGVPLGHTVAGILQPIVGKQKNPAG